MRKRTTLPPELMAEWADERAVGAVSVRDKAKWRCITCEFEWEAMISNRLRGAGCPRCAYTKQQQANRRSKIQTLPPELHKEWADERLVNSVSAQRDKVRWHHNCGYEWETTIHARLQGYGCPSCGGSPRGGFREHPDFDQISQYVPHEAKGTDRITLPCKTCKEPYSVAIKAWLRLNSRQHKKCADPVRTDHQMPLGMVCLEPEKYTKVNSTTKLLFLCKKGHEIFSTKASLDNSARRNAPGCPRCSLNAPISSRLATEAPDILAVGAISSPASAVAILSALGKSSHKEIAAYKRMLEMQQGGMSASEAIAEMTKRGDDDFDASDVDSDIDSDSDAASDLDEPQLDAWNKQRVDNLFDALGKVDRLFVDGAISDETAYQFLVDEQVATLWNAYCDLESKPSTSATTPTSLNTTSFVASVREQASSTSRLLSTVAQTFLRQHDGAAALHVPVGFKPRGGDNKPLVPRMMQRLIAWHLTEGGRQRFGNWSAPGAGKTLAALLTARLAQSRLTVVICPNNVIPTWQAQIDRTYNHGKRINVVAEIQTWQPHDDADFLILNYDRLQGADAEAQALKFCEDYGSRIGLVVVDECHRAKNDGQIGQQGSGGKAGPSSRRRVLDVIVKALPKSKLLIQTGTPVLTGCAEGVSLIDLIDETAQTTYGFTRKNSFNECMRLHQAMTRYGVRFKPRVGVELLSPSVRRADGGEYCQSKDGKRGLELVTPRDDLAPLIEITDADAIAKLSDLKRGRGWSWLDIDEILTPFKLDAIVEAIRPGTVVYTEHVGGDRADPVVTTIAKAVKKAGFTVAVFDGRADSVKGHDTIAAVDGTCTCKRCRGLAAFKRGEVAVLVASRTIGEGVDGLQQVGNRVIVNSPPWHDGAWEQLVGRWFRSGQTRNVEVVVPITWMASPSGRVSLDMLRLSRINDRGNIADAVVDGALPTHVGGLGELVAAAKAELEKLG